MLFFSAVKPKAKHRNRLDFQCTENLHFVSTIKLFVSLSLVHDEKYLITSYTSSLRFSSFTNNSLTFLSFLNLSPLSRQLLPLRARSYSSSTSCQEVGIVAYVSSSMSVHEGERGDGSKLLGGKKTPREQRELLLNSVFVCWLLTLQNELTNWWGRGKKIPISTTKRPGLFLDVLLSSQPNDELCS